MLITVSKKGLLIGLVSLGSQPQQIDLAEILIQRKINRGQCVDTGCGKQRQVEI